MTETTQSTLSSRQQEILDFLRHFRETHGYPPSVRDICRGARISSTSVVDHNLKALERMGLIKRAREISRGIELIDQETERQMTEVISLPIVGRIAAGQPIEAVAADNEAITVSAALAPANAFVLKVKGKSMIEDLIDDGDLVIIRPQANAESGDIVVALISDGPTGEGQATLKRFYREKDRIRLQPANSEMEPIFVEPSKLDIQGKVVAVIRQM